MTAAGTAANISVRACWGCVCFAFYKYRCGFINCIHICRATLRARNETCFLVSHKRHDITFFFAIIAIQIIKRHKNHHHSLYYHIDIIRILLPFSSIYFTMSSKLSHTVAVLSLGCTPRRVFPLSSLSNTTSTCALLSLITPSGVTSP